MVRFAHAVLEAPAIHGVQLLVEASERGVRRVSFLRPGPLRERDVDAEEAPPSAATACLDAALDELTRYLAGEEIELAAPIDIDDQGTPFLRAVWEELGRIPRGELTSYGEIARRVGSPRAVRAVGRAVGANPIALRVPCHRVVGGDRSLTGFSGGLDIKERLLELEGFVLEPAAESRRRRVLGTRELVATGSEARGSHRQLELF